MDDLYQKLKIECDHSSFHAFAFNYIFDKRAISYSKKINLLNVFGILTPALIGMVALGYGYNTEILKKSILLAIPIVTIQFCISVWATLFDWANNLSYSYEASQSYNSLWVRFKKLSEYPPATYEELRIQYDLLYTEALSRNQQDMKFNIKEWEVRRGHRAALREYKRSCSGCEVIPLSIKSTNCDICGNFNNSFLKS